MNIALIIAGGSGQRMRQEIPKQFLNVNDKPVIIYTLEAFQSHPDIDKIGVVCLDGWYDILRAYARQYGISKLKWITGGGQDGQESIHKGVLALQEVCDEKDVIMVHDGISPFVPEEIITDAIRVCQRCDSGLSAVRCQETIVRTADGISGSEGIGRQEIMRVQTPQAYRYGKARWAYEEAERRGIHGEVYVNTLMLHLGETVYFSKGSEKNVKITTMDDLEIFKLYLQSDKIGWLK